MKRSERTLVFVDCGDTLFLNYGQQFNKGLVSTLDQVAEAGHDILFMTGGDPSTYERLLQKFVPHFPAQLKKAIGKAQGILQRKKDLRGIPLPVVIDDWTQQELASVFEMVPSYYVNAKGQTDPNYYRRQFSAIPGLLPPSRALAGDAISLPAKEERLRLG